MKSLNKILFILVLLCLFGCSAVKVAKPLQGGSASATLAQFPTLTVSQAENSQTPTVAKYERRIIPLSNTNTNTIYLEEKYETELGTHQTDEARAGFAAVQKTAAVLKAQSPIMYAGLVLIVAALAMSYFQAKFPLVFSPGLKLIALTFLTGLFLCVLPALVHNNTVLMVAMLGGVGVIIAFTLAKNFHQSTTTNNSATIADTNSKENNND